MKDPEKPGRFTYSTDTKFEFQFGYSRAVRHGIIIRVAGTAGLREDGTPVEGSAADQARRALDIIDRSLKELGADFSDVIMTRVYVKNVEDIADVAVVHGDVFRNIRPATTIVKVDFIDPKILVEIEMEAVYGGKDEAVNALTAPG